MTKNVSTVNLLSTIAAASIITLITGCGGGDSASTATTTTSTTLSGTFVDAPVAGLDYNCTSGLHGKTDAAGTFSYKAGDTCEFKIGSLSLGSALITGVTTPYMLADGNTTIAGNIAALLQTLDSDANASKILISSDHNLTVGSFDFRSATFDTALGSYATAHRLIHIHPAQAIEAMNGYLFSSFSDKEYTMTTSQGRMQMEFYKNGQFVQTYDGGEINSGSWTSLNGTTATVVFQDYHKMALTMLSSTSASIKYEDEATAMTVNYTVQNTASSIWNDPRNTANEVFKNLNITNLNGGALTRWNDGLIPVKLNGSKVAEEAINRIEAVLGRVIFDRTIIANTPEGDITRGITVSEMTTVDRKLQYLYGPDWRPCGEQTGTLNGKQHLDIGSAQCLPSTDIAIHEFAHALGMGGTHYEGYGVGPAIGGGFWSVLKTMYSNAIGSTKANITVYWGITENNITGATTAASGL